MIITYQQLVEGYACEEACEWFQKTFGDQCELTRENLEKVPEMSYFMWLRDFLASAEDFWTSDRYEFARTLWGYTFTSRINTILYLAGVEEPEEFPEEIYDGAE